MTCDIALYGHMTFDTIFDTNTITTAIGSIGNVWKALKYINPYISIAVEPTEFGEALILIDRINNKRTSRASLSNFLRVPNVHDSKWSHILYINELRHKHILDEAKGIISADLCKGKNLDYNLLKNVDWLFTSEEEGCSKNLLQVVKRGLIIHSSTSATIMTKETSKTVQVEQALNNVNVLGAGDFFAASVICNMLKNDATYECILTRAHRDAYRMIKDEI